MILLITVFINHNHYNKKTYLFQQYNQFRSKTFLVIGQLNVYHFFTKPYGARFSAEKPRAEKPSTGRFLRPALSSPFEFYANQKSRPLWTGFHF